MEDLTGIQLGAYRVTAPLGEGGMAAVYKAYQPGMDRFVALKVLPRHLAQEENYLGRFRQEAQVVARLQHPHILPAYDFGDDNGYTFIVMPFIESGTLAEKLQGRPLPLPLVSKIIAQLADALDYAHRKGVIHRDIKPSNVLLDENENCLLTDFGIARLVAGSAHFTRTGGIIGTPAYMSPEQGLGQTLTNRSDIYSLGIILYEMATGRVPYSAETPIATVMKHIHDPLPSPLLANAALPPAMERVIHKALAKEPQDRFATAGDMAAALDMALRDQYDAPTFIEHPAPPAAQEKSRPVWIIAAAVILILIICSGAAYAAISYFTSQASPTPVVVVGTGSETAVSEPPGLTPTFDEVLPAGSETPVPEIIEAERSAEPLPTVVETAVPELTDLPTAVPSPTLDTLPPLINDSQGHPMVFVPAGQFTMGTAATRGYAECQALLYNETCQLSWFEDEEPVHIVDLDDFYIDMYEITNAQFANFLNLSGNQNEAGAFWLDTDDEDVRIRQAGGQWTAVPGFESHPVVEVNWYAAGAYCRQRGARLPTEAEWEKAARGTDERLYPWGGSYDESRANMCDVNCDLDWANPFYNDGYATTAPVGSYPNGAGPYGAYDMAGNVLEWTRDWYAPDSYIGAPASNPTGALSGEFRVTRGGSWTRNGRSVRVSYRYGFAPADGTGDVGFRCLLEVE